MTYWIYWTVFSVLGFAVVGIIIKLLYDILQELHKQNRLNKDPKTIAQIDAMIDDWAKEDS